MENSTETSSKTTVINSSAIPETSSHLSDRTLAEEIADNEHQMYLKSQQHIQEIEDEVLL